MVAYPYLAEYWNSLARSEVIVHYNRLSEQADSQVLERARQYNQQLFRSGQTGEDYDRQLNIDSQGMMGYVTIPKIHCDLPVFHSTEEAVMQNSVGHLKQSSLPVGGESTHSVLSAHRGALSSRLSTDLDRLETGDIFMLTVLDETLVYEIDRIITVLPEQTDALAIEKGKDLCTLVTCTPFGINTHRLLVRGHRVPEMPEQKKEERTVILLLAAILPVAVCLAAVTAVRKHSRLERR